MAADLTTGDILFSISDKNPFPTTSLQLEFIISDLDQTGLYLGLMKETKIIVH